MNALAALGELGELVVLAPGVRHRAGERDHLLQHGDLAIHRVAVGRDQARGSRAQPGEELVAVLGEQAHRVGAEQLVVADRGRDRLRVLVRGQPRLGVVFAVAAGLERIDADRLLAGEARRCGDLGISLLELSLAPRPVGHEVVLLLCRGEEFRDCRDRHRRPHRIALRRHVVRRARRAGIDRRMFQHVVDKHDPLAAPALGEARAPLVGDRLPVGLSLLLVSRAGADIGFDRGARGGGAVGLALRE